MNLQANLSAQVDGEVKSDQSTLAAYSRDASAFTVTPQAVVWPKHIEDISSLIEYVNKHRGNLSITARAGGTCMSGGPLGQSIVLDVSKHLNRIKVIGDHYAVVEPGVFYRDFAAAAQKRNFLLPSYPASKDICTVGGMVNNNSGGEKTLAYGKTEQYVQQLKVMLADGKEYALKPISADELKHKRGQDSFEGRIYQRLFDLIENNYDDLQQAKPPVSKNSTGYALWNVWDKQRFDLTQLFVGSQGTLGITTEITFKLVTPRPQVAMLVIFLTDIKSLADVVQRILTYQPESFESYDHHTLKLALRFLPQLLKKTGAGSLLSLLWQFVPELRMIATGGLPQLVLLAEFTGYSQPEVLSRAQAAAASIQPFKPTTRLVKTRQEAQKYWAIRHESFNLLRHKAGKERTVPFIDDLIIRPQQLPDFLPKLENVLRPYHITYTIAGHVGDANLHIIPLMDLSQPEQRAIIPELAEKVYDLVFSFHGSMSGEHNDGIIRSPYLEKMYGKKIYNLFVQTKHIFDPHNIFNPGKKVGSSWQYAMEHLIRE
jgi:FAD/FMN-containing dehydrogenase